MNIHSGSSLSGTKLIRIFQLFGALLILLAGMLPVYQPERVSAAFPQMSVGSCAVVTGASQYGGLKVRSGPGLSYSQVGLLQDGTVIKITCGPISADGYTWWQHDHGGWSAGTYLADTSCESSSFVFQLTAGLAINPSSPYPGQSTNAAFKAKNNGGSPFTLQYLGVKCRRTSDQANYDFAWMTNVTLSPGQEYSYSTNRSFDQVAAYSCTPNYEYNNNWSDVHWSNGSTNYVTINVQNAPPSPGNLILSQDLSVSTTAPAVGQDFNGTFKVKNNGGQAMTIQYLGIQGRLNGDLNGQNGDFAWIQNLSLQPGQEYTYSANRSLPTAGNWTLRPNYEYSNSWSDVHRSDGTVDTLWVTVSNPVTPGNIQLTQGLAFNPGIPAPGQNTNASFKAKNNGGQAITLGHLGVKCRRNSDQANYDFAWILNVTLQPGQEYSYSTNRAFDQATSYWCTPNYEQSGAWNDVKWSNGTTNYVTVNVQVPSTTYSISGTIQTGGTTPLAIAGVAVIDNQGHSTTSNAQGAYTLTGLAAGAYTLTATKTGYSFSPTSLAVSLAGNVSGKNFIGTPTGNKPWLLMYYMVGDNNLNPRAQSVFEQLKAHQGSSAYNIAVMFDGAANNDSRYYYIADNTVFVVKNELNSGDPNTLIDFVKWARGMFPADHTALVLWDHGSLATTMQDVSQNRSMRVQELAGALKQIVSQTGKMDILQLDACLMGSIEDAYEFQPAADFYIASENEGWVPTPPSYLNSIPETMTPESLAVQIASNYHNYWTGGKYPHTISVARISNLPLLADKVNTFAGQLTTSLSSLGGTWLKLQVLAQVQKFRFGRKRTDWHAG